MSQPTRRARLAAVLPLLWLFVVPPAHAQQTVYTLDPAQTQILYQLAATLHTVHGTFKLKSGQIRFDPQTGKASGAIVVDAATGNSGTESRDNKMKSQVIESQKYPEIAFIPQQVKGSVISPAAAPGAPPANGQVQVRGIFRIHGQDHPLTLNFQIQTAPGGLLQASTEFSVPYVQWGMKNPSTFLLRVDAQVNIEIHALGRIAAAPADK